ncbi:MAG: hypothetical protein ACRCUH_10740 [Shewanella sp.]
MFKVNFSGVPALKMVPFEEIDNGTLYLSSDQSAVLFRDSDGEYIVYDLDSRQVLVYHWDCALELRENHPSCSALYPAEVVKVSMAFEIVGGSDAD